MGLVKKDYFNTLPDFECVNLTYQRIFDRSLDDSDHLLSVEQLYFAINMHRVAIEAAHLKCFHLTFDRLDSKGSDMYDYCDGIAWYWPQFMAQVIDKQHVRRNKPSYFEELNSVLKERGYDPEPYCTTRKNWHAYKKD